MDELRRILVPGPPAPPPPGLADVVRRRARRRRQRRITVVTGVAVSVAAAVVVIRFDRFGSSSLQPVDHPPPTVVPSPRWNGRSESRPVSRAGGGVPRSDAVPSHSPDVRVPTPVPQGQPARDWWQFAVYRGNPPPANEGGVRCVDAGYGPHLDINEWRSGPPGWCFHMSDEWRDPAAPRTNLPDVWHLGAWLCRNPGAGDAALALDQLPRLRVSSDGESGPTDVVLDSAVRWPARYANWKPDQVRIADGACALLYLRWDTRDNGGRYVADGTYWYELTVTDPAFADWFGSLRSLIEVKRGEKH